MGIESIGSLLISAGIILFLILVAVILIVNVVFAINFLRKNKITGFQIEERETGENILEKWILAIAILLLVMVFVLLGSLLF